MRLRQSVVLWQGITLFGKRPSTYYGNNSSNKQRGTTVHYFKTWRSVNLENVKKCKSCFKFSRKKHQALWWNWLSLVTPQERKTRVTSAAEDKFIRVTSLRNCSPNKCFRVQVTDTSQHQLFRGDCVNQVFIIELLQRNHYLRTPIRRRDLFGPRNTSNGH